jgi:hypothetical protein
MLAVHQLCEGLGCVTSRADRTGEFAVDGENAAQRLEGAEAETLALVLDADLAEAKSCGEGGQRIKWRGPVPGAFGEHVAELGNAVGIDHEALLAAEGEARPDAGIFGQPGRNHARS